MEEEKHKLIKHILDQYKNGKPYDYKSNGWYEYDSKSKPPITILDLLNMIEKLIDVHPRNIIKILEALPEEEIQKFLRAKKMAKIKSK